MNDTEQLILRGKSQLDNYSFSDELIEEIEPYKYRDSLLRSMFKPDNTPLDELTPEQKQKRKNILNFKFVLDDYLQAFDKYSVASYILLITGIVMILFSLLRFNSNLIVSIITVLQGTALLFISRNRKLSISSIIPVIIVLTITIIIELLLFGFPKPLFEMMSRDVLQSRRGSLTRILNQLTPYIYIIIKVCALSFLAIIYTKKKKFLEARKKFEANKN